LLVSNKFFEGAVSCANWFYKKNAFLNLTDNVLYSTNSLSTDEVSRVLNDIKLGSTSYIQTLDKEFFLILIDVREDLVHVINDITGRDLVYYCEDNNSISTCFWEIIKVEEKSLKHVNPTSCKEFILMLADVEHKTIVDGIEILPTSSVFTFSKNAKITKHKYWTYRIHENSLASNEKYDQLENCLDSFFSDLASRYKDVVFGVGVSGGLDSRLIPYYCNKHSILISPFIIGEEKPNGLVRSNDHKRASEICEKYSLPLVNHNFENHNFKGKIIKDARQAPSTASQILKMPQTQFISFSHLITGASGYIVGSSPFYGNPENIDLTATIFNRQSVLKCFPKYKKTKKVLNYIFGSNFNVSEKLPFAFEGLLSHEEVSSLKAKVENYINTYKGLNNTEILMNYAVDILGQRNKMGAFESLLGDVESFTMYGPAMLKCVQSWNSKEIFNRSFFENFIRERHPELAAIKSQDHKSSLNITRESKLSKIRNIAEFAVRGRGVMNYENWAKSRKFINEVNNILEEYNYLEEILDLKLIIKNVNKGIISPLVLLNCLKINELMHLIDRGT